MFAGSLLGCATDAPINPSFPVTNESADRILEQAAVHPKSLARPLVIVGGFLDPGIASLVLQHRFEKYTGDDRVIPVALGFCFSFDQCRSRIIDAVDDRFPNSDPNETTEVDVVGYSLGGIAARYAAIEAWQGHTPTRRLRIARLFTISAPHRGAVAVAALPFPLHPLLTPLMPESAFMERLNASVNPNDIYPIYSYVRLADEQVGVEDAAPTGQTAWWAAGPAFSLPHVGAFLDRRFLADIVTRLRGETPMTTEPPTPAPRALVDADHRKAR